MNTRRLRCVARRRHNWRPYAPPLVCRDCGFELDVKRLPLIWRWRLRGLR